VHGPAEAEVNIHPGSSIADRGELGGLECPPSGEDRESGLVEVDAAPGVVGLAA
jgi:hypothetical protein